MNMASAGVQRRIGQCLLNDPVKTRAMGIWQRIRVLIDLHLDFNAA